MTVKNSQLSYYYFAFQEETFEMQFHTFPSIFYMMAQQPFR
jgi:hypothetical protein